MDAVSSQLERRQAEEREDDRDDDEPRDHFRLAPADEFEMVMDGRHPEDALPGQLERRDLDDDGKRLEHEDASDDDEHELLLDEQRDRPECATERERPD